MNHSPPYIAMHDSLSTGTIAIASAPVAVAVPSQSTAAPKSFAHLSTTACCASGLAQLMSPSITRNFHEEIPLLLLLRSLPTQNVSFWGGGNTGQQIIFPAYQALLSQGRVLRQPRVEKPTKKLEFILTGSKFIPASRGPTLPPCSLA